MATHEIPEVFNYFWTTRHSPTLSISSGATISFDRIPEASGGQFDSYSPGDPVPELDLNALYPMLGPIWVEGAEPGDVLELELLEYESHGWGWTAILPGMGLLAEDFPDPYLHIWDFEGSSTANFKDAAEVPVRPFLGVLASTPDTDEPQGVIPPGPFGGNIDCRDLVAGVKVFLPVQTPGARLMLSDPHAAQGDGEVCVSAIEAPLGGSMKVSLHKGWSIPTPQFQTPGPLRSGIEDSGYYATMGIGPDLMTASKDAVRYMVDHISGKYGLDPVDAYVLSSVAVDLKITEVVDAPNWAVSAYLPLSIMK
ncbi:acetamidase/formamidase family protein [Nesterenkonia alkaliphila]|uniref:Acetamidase n=1 Tax=Nesterenkonia alkaliphila TaxID=1463631 RepID=A0A7K1UF01_9MICC|nr:acetamidase/formamidase family protein [Nesterenkonia alkaliphila]MVT25050.1 acetamidase [Nesterenkonia alkaliphila]GFZ97437.1 acetamidase [Nesterenkonia alkaliphila]